MDDKEVFKKKSIYFYLRVKGGVIGFKGNSMFPVLRQGEQIEVKPVEIKNISIGEIIAFDAIDKLIVHRVIGKIKKRNQIFFLEKGDNSHFIGIKPADKVIGKVKTVIELPSEINVDLWRRRNFILITWCSAVCLLYTMLFEIKRFIFKNKTSSISKYMHNLYWKACFLIPKVFFRNTNSYKE